MSCVNQFDALTALNRTSYDLSAQVWDLRRKAFPAIDHDFLQRNVPSCVKGLKALDLGCGTGQPIAKWLIAQGAHLLGVDQSEKMIQRATWLYPKAQWCVARIQDFDPPGEIDIVIAWDALFHIPRELHAGIFRRLRRAMPYRAKLLATFGGASTPPFTREVMGQVFYFDSWPPEITISLLEECGFEIEDATFLEKPTSSGNKGRVAIAASAA